MKKPQEEEERVNCHILRERISKISTIVNFQKEFKGNEINYFGFDARTILGTIKRAFSVKLWLSSVHR